MAKRLKICLINPKFEPSYWGFEYALPLYPGNKKSSMITGALPHLAAHHDRMMQRQAVKRTCEIESQIGYELPDWFPNK